MARKNSKTRSGEQADAPASDDLAVPVPRDDAERKIVESFGSPSRMVYVLLAASPLSCLGAHLAYARGGRALAGCLGFLAIGFAGSVASAAAFLLGRSDAWAEAARGTDPKEDPRSAAVGALLIFGALWFLSICSAVAWIFRGGAEWRRRQAARAKAAIVAKREAERKEAEDATRREKEEKQRQELAEMRERHLIPLYGGDASFPALVREGRLAIGMTRKAVEDALGKPCDTKEDISTSGRKDRLYFREQVGARGKVSYGLEVTLIGGRVVKIKDL